MSELLSGTGLCLFRGDRCLFKSLDFALKRGELLVVEGPNGSGKTSLLRGIAGLLEFETGEVHWAGRPVLKHYQAFRGELAWFAHRPGFKADLDIMENLRFEATLRPTDSAATATVLERLGLTRQTDIPFRSLSAGQQRRAALARTLLSRAPLWMMDEPFTNLDRAGQALVRDLVEEHLAADGACVLATHQPIEIEGRTRRVVLQ